MALMTWWDLTVDTVSCINLVLSIGLCVDYSVHIALHFMQVIFVPHVIGNFSSMSTRTASSAFFQNNLHSLFSRSREQGMNVSERLCGRWALR